ncbi:GNAT family N-acetyltransferase [Pontibacillus sp. HMF3514]|uniref:GNAT family N-acetyltransferase n=1 Tax=Pontibacillus sp. HMF3514 TaxID=2692425 RepID=UPI00131F6844|nr:GNAT family N-acetyltransferase [Pontibacillus sp. HMF3514]QHE50804.1 GNAT family N-acetyltransferase [Pontibacillus sp. HMF3514]
MIRIANKDDIKDILFIYNDAVVNTTAVYDYEPYSYENRVQWFEKKQKASVPIMVYEEDGEVCGFATYGAFRDWPAYQYTVEHSVYVNPKHGGKGIGGTLLKEIIKAAKQDGYITMVAGIDGTNKGSISLHEKVGFTYSGTIQKAGYKFDRWLDLAFYQIDLERVNN